MSNLGQQGCSACSADAPQVTDAEKQTLLKDVPEWQLIVQDGEEQLQRVFTFKNFVGWGTATISFSIHNMDY